MTNQNNQDGAAGQVDGVHRSGAGLPRALFGRGLGSGGQGGFWVFGFVVPVVLCAGLIFGAVLFAEHGPAMVAQVQADGP